MDEATVTQVWCDPLPVKVGDKVTVTIGDFSVDMEVAAIDADGHYRLQAVVTLPNNGDTLPCP